MSSPLLLATTNRGKVGELAGMLGRRFRCLVPGSSAETPQSPPEVVEDGSTYYENALKKAVAFHRAYGQPVLSDDTGIEVDCLNGAPGLHSARYGGAAISWPERWQFLLKELSPFPQSRWTCRFRAVLCYYDGRGVPRFYEGMCSGRVLPRPAGGMGFGYDPIVFVDALGKSFGEATDAEKNAVSHRAIAVNALLSDLDRARPGG